MDKDGNLFLNDSRYVKNGNEMKLYKHTGAQGMYLGDIDPKEKAVVKKLTFAPRGYTRGRPPKKRTNIGCVNTFFFIKSCSRFVHYHCVQNDRHTLHLVFCSPNIYQDLYKSAVLWEKVSSVTTTGSSQGIVFLRLSNMNCQSASCIHIFLTDLAIQNMAIHFQA